MNVYAPYTPVGKRNFVRWFKNIQMPDEVDWLLVGAFNLYRNLEDHNKPGANFAEMLLFNETINALGLVELPLKGQCFIWTNKQNMPLLERSTSWTTSYPNALVSTLIMETSGHVPCLISISTNIPKGHIFRFENFWLQRDDFLLQVQLGWFGASDQQDATKNITTKFKNLRRVLKQWK